MLVFEERGKPEKNLSEQGREPTTNKGKFEETDNDVSWAAVLGEHQFNPGTNALI